MRRNTQSEDAVPGPAATSRADVAPRVFDAAPARLATDVPHATSDTFAEVFAAFPDLAWLLEARHEPSYVYVQVNPALLNWAGVDDAAVVVGRTPAELLPPDA